MSNRLARATALGVVIACAVVPLASAQFAAVTLDDYSGEELFGRFCASCHGAGARGNGPVAATLNVSVPDLTTIRVRYGEFREGMIRDVIDGRGIDMQAHGTRTMPVWGRELWVEEGADVDAQKSAREAIDKLVQYLRSLQRDEDQVRGAR
jgi:mono/diheme cytochrome c family protein